MLIHCGYFQINKWRILNAFTEVTSFQVVLRALGHEIDAKENEALKFMFPEGTVVFSDYMKLLTQWILSIDEDLDVSKAFSLFDVDGKGFIDLEDLRRVRDLLGFSHEIDDAELINMLIGAQVLLLLLAVSYIKMNIISNC